MPDEGDRGAGCEDEVVVGWVLDVEAEDFDAGSVDERFFEELDFVVGGVGAILNQAEGGVESVELRRGEKRLVYWHEFAMKIAIVTDKFELCTRVPGLESF